MKILKLGCLLALSMMFTSTGCALDDGEVDEAEELEDWEPDTALEESALKSCSFFRNVDVANGQKISASASINTGTRDGLRFVKDISWNLDNGLRFESGDNKVTLRFQTFDGSKWVDLANESFRKLNIADGPGQGTVNRGVRTTRKLRAKIHFSFDQIAPLPYHTGACYIAM